MIFLSPTGNAELVLKLHIALCASHCSHHNANVKIPPECSPPHVNITILIQLSRDPDHLPSTVAITLPPFQLNFSWRITGHCLGIFRIRHFLSLQTQNSLIFTECILSCISIFKIIELYFCQTQQQTKQQLCTLYEREFICVLLCLTEIKLNYFKDKIP
jgi:hypothetical protein